MKVYCIDCIYYISHKKDYYYNCCAKQFIFIPTNDGLHKECIDTKELNRDLNCKHFHATERTRTFYFSPN